MLYLVEFIDDNSYCFIKDSDIDNNAEEVTKNSSVDFYFNGKKHHGIILNISESENNFKNYFKKFQAAERQKKIDLENEIAHDKRQRGKKRSFSSGEDSIFPPAKTKKKVFKNDKKNLKGKKQTTTETTSSQNLVSEAITRNNKELKRIASNKIISDSSDEENSPLTDKSKQNFLNTSDEDIEILKNLNNDSLLVRQEMLKVQSEQQTTPKSSKLLEASSKFNKEKRESFVSKKIFWRQDDDVHNFDSIKERMTIQKSASLPFLLYNNLIIFIVKNMSYFL